MIRSAILFFINRAARTELFARICGAWQKSRGLAFGSATPWSRTRRWFAAMLCFFWKQIYRGRDPAGGGTPTIALVNGRGNESAESTDLESDCPARENISPLTLGHRPRGGQFASARHSSLSIVRDVVRGLCRDGIPSPSGRGQVAEISFNAGKRGRHRPAPMPSSSGSGKTRKAPGGGRDEAKKKKRSCCNPKLKGRLCPDRIGSGPHKAEGSCALNRLIAAQVRAVFVRKQDQRRREPRRKTRLRHRIVTRAEQQIRGSREFARPAPDGRRG